MEEFNTQQIMITLQYEADDGDASTQIKICELPVYGNPVVNVSVLPEKKGQFRESISVVRGALWTWLDSIQGTRDKVKDKYETGKAHTQSTIDHIKSDEGVLPRAAVIGISGLAGIVLAYKGDFMRKACFSSIAVAVAMSVCYPKEAVYVTTHQYETIKNKVQKLRGKNSPEDS